MKEDHEYFRVGTKYYWKTDTPNLNEEMHEELIDYNLACLKIDIGSDAANSIPVYKKMINHPSHTNYRQVIGGCYNRYQKIQHEPKKGGIENSLKYLRHIFGDQLELGLDYLKIIFEYPTQILPVLILVSNERNTGKSTLLKWLKYIFGYNVAYLEHDSFTATHNSDWAPKLLICLDEVQFTTKQEVDKLKRLSTSDKYMSRAMFKDKEEIDFFGKFLICSNYETTVIPIDQDEIRFWVRKIAPLKDSPFFVEDENQEESFQGKDYFLDLLKEETPAFLDFLINRNYSVPNTTRMWFEPEDIWTEQLDLIKEASRPTIEKDSAHVLYDAMIELNINEIKFNALDLHLMLKTMRLRYQPHEVRKMINNNWKLTTRNSSYRQVILLSNNTFAYNEELKKSGRHYTITKEFIEEKYKEYLNVGS